MRDEVDAAQEHYSKRISDAFAQAGSSIGEVGQQLGDADLRSLLDVGLTLEEAWDVAEIAAMYNFTNRMAMATNMLPNEEYAAMARG